MNYDYDYGFGYNYDYPAGYGNGGNMALSLLMTVYLIILAVVIAIALASYILHSIGLYTIGKRMGRDHAWLAFIPYARNYFHGELAGEIPLKNKSIRNPGIWKLVLPIIYGSVMGVLVIFMVAAILGVGVAAGGNGNAFAGLSMFATTFIGIYVVLLAWVVVYSAVYTVLKILINVQIYEKFTTRNMAVAHAVLSGIIPLYEAICFFVLRNRDFNQGMGQNITPPPAAQVYPGNKTE